MTRDGEIAMLGEHLATVARLADRLVVLRARLESIMPIDADRMRGLDPDRDIDVLAFLKTFEQLEDTLGRTLKTIAMLMQLGKVERLTPRDVAQRAAALGVIDDPKVWADAVRVRNELAHEYPLRPDKQAAQVNAAWEKSETLFATRASIDNFVERERLLHGDI
ncbi:hypothetical protein F4693_002598 [Sphingomonas endophytica]|uniref:DUF86 domain-containing protein n=1 Tax=Sphingomonas endophytica TaxID=869719 RepID=A0A7X0MNW5_9SPHN|nr:nucleotidyltransferase substrate binding protein [Sphingomonas endophytica]MBB6505606.1 hypothetical protein [Sphingomonas endophytica]